MKAKIFTVLAALAMTAMVSAQTFNRIVVNIEQGSGSDELYLIESPSFTDDFENSYDEAKGFIGGSIYVYGSTTYGAQSMVCTNSLQGAVIGYRATADGTATITFSDLQSDLADVTTYYLLDTEDNSYHAIGEGASFKYNFSAVAGDHANRFMIVEPVKVTLNAYGWASFSSNIDLALPTSSDLKAYKGELNANLDQLMLNEVDDIPANAGVILHGTAGQMYNLVPMTATADMTGNVLKPTSAYTVGDQNVFVLKGDALLEYVGSNALAANKAYLQLPGSVPAPKRIRMVVNQVTGVENVGQEPMANCQKLMIDGQVFIRRGNEVYNLQGQIVK